MSITNIKDIAMKLWDDCNKHIEETDEKVNKEEYKMENKMYTISVICDNKFDNDVKLIGIFSNKDKVKEKIMEWIKKNEYDEYSIFVTCTKFNHITSCEIRESI